MFSQASGCCLVKSTGALPHNRRQDYSHIMFSAPVNGKSSVIVISAEMLLISLDCHFQKSAKLFSWHFSVM